MKQAHGGRAKRAPVQKKSAEAIPPADSGDCGNWRDAVRRFVLHLKTSRRSELTWTHYEADLKAFAAWWGESSADELTPRAVTEYHVSAWQDYLVTTPIPAKSAAGVERKRKGATTNAKLSALKSFLRWAARAKVIPAAPEAPAREKLGHRMVRSLDKRQQGTLLSRASHRPRDFALIRMLIDSGLRVAELVEVRWRDIVLKRGGSIHVLGKGRKPRLVPTSPELRAALRAIRDGAPDDDQVFQGKRGPLTVRGVQQVLERYEDPKVGLGNLTPHMLRHCFAINHRDRKTPWPTIAALMGHSSVKTTMDNYAVASERDLIMAIDPGFFEAGEGDDE